MGGILQSVFGGSNSKQSSTSQSTANSLSFNRGYDTISQGLAPQVAGGTGAFKMIQGLLGAGGDPAAAQGAFNNYLGSTGYNFVRDQGVNAITGSNAAKGLLNSGSTLKGITKFGQDLGNTYFNNYLNNLQSLVSGGNAAAGQIGGAGGVSSSTAQSTSMSKGKGSSSNGILPVLFG